MLASLVALMPAEVCREYQLTYRHLLSLDVAAAADSTVRGDTWLAKLLLAIGEALCACAVYRDSLVVHGGFAALGWALEQLPASLLTSSVATACVEGVLRCGLLDVGLLCKGLLLVLFESRIWGRAPAATQVYWIRRLREYVHDHPLECRVVVGVQTVFTRHARGFRGQRGGPGRQRATGTRSRGEALPAARLAGFALDEEDGGATPGGGGGSKAAHPAAAVELERDAY
jgi:hypothetical protein